MPNTSYQNLKSPLEIKVEWSRTSSVPPLALSISAFMLNKKDVANKLENFVFYGTPSNGNNIISSDKSITCDILNFENGFGSEGTHNMKLELGYVSESVDRINFIVSINEKGEELQHPAFDSLKTAIFSVSDAAGFTFTTELNNTGEASCQCIVVGCVRRYGEAWRFEEEMELKLGGLELVYNEYMCNSILKCHPFSEIGDLKLIEKKDGNKTILEKNTKMSSTAFSPQKGKKKHQKPWKMDCPPNRTEQKTKVLSSSKNSDDKKPWKGLIKKAELTEEASLKDSSGQENQTAQKGSWPHKRTEHSKEDKSQSQMEVEKDVSGATPRRKFPKIEQPGSLKETGLNSHIERKDNSQGKRKFPKVGNSDNI